MSKQKIQSCQAVINQAETFFDTRQNVISSTENFEAEYDNEMQQLIEMTMNLFEKAAGVIFY